jgi:hypothetical protein
MSCFNSFKTSFFERSQGRLSHLADDLSLAKAASECGSPKQLIRQNDPGSSPGGANQKVATS